MRRDFKGIRVAPVCRSLAGVFESVTMSQVAHPRNLRFPSVSQKAPLPSSLCDDTVSPAGSVGAERCPLGTCAPIGGGRPPHRGGRWSPVATVHRRSPLPLRSVLDAPHRGAGPEAAAETCRRTATGGVRVKSRSSRFTRSKSPYESPGELPDCHSPLGGAEPRKSFLGSFFSKKLRPEKRKEVAPCALGTWKYRAGRPWPPWPG